jgi:PAS domain S-box-containing protein
MSGKSEKRSVDVTMLAHALRSVSESVVVTDMLDTILFVNDAFLQTYGYTEDELIGGNIDVVRSPSNPKEITDKILPATLAGGWSGEVLNRRSNGEEFPVSLSTSVVRDEHHRPISLIGVAVDITARKRAERELVLAREAAESADRAKSQFLAAMSHEIRTPMNAVIGMTELLLGTALSEEQRDFVQTIHVSGESLLTIINDILDFSKIESGMLELERRPFDIRAAVEELIKLLLPKSLEKGLNLTYEIQSNVPAVIEGDVIRFKQVLINLISNGIKFTEIGRVAVRVGARSMDGDIVEIRCEVRDTGIGIAPDKLDRLFKPFSQVDASTTRRFGGTGLGLVISKRIVDLMGGVITAESVADKGSIFCFSLLAKASAGIRAVPSTVLPGESNLAMRFPAKLLIVEDNPVNQRLAVIILNQLGYQPEVVDNGTHALIAAQRRNYDMIFMDVHMPDMDGLEVTRRIREIPDISRPWIIALTADVLAGDREKCLNAGMDDYIGKPIRRDEMQAAIKRWAAKRSTERASDQMGGKSPLLG